MNEAVDLPQPAKANQRSSKFGGRVLAFVLVVAIIASMAAAYVYFFQKHEKMVLTVAAGLHQSDSYILLSEMAEVVARHSDTLEVKITATGSPSENISLLNRREFDLATIRASTPVDASVRMVANLYPDYFQLITNGISEISSFRGLIGKRVAIPPYGTEANRFFFVLVDHFDLDVSKFSWKAVDFKRATKLVFGNKVDALFTVRSLRDRQLLKFFEDAQLKALPVEFVPVGQAGAIALKRPFLSISSIPKGAFVGATPTPSNDVETTIITRILVSRSDVSKDAVRELTRVLFEHRLDLTMRFPLAIAINQPNAATGLTIPLHEGADAYYNRDQPSFLQENAEPLALVITVFAMFISALFALRGRLTANRKNRLDSYNYQLLAIADTARVTNELTKLKNLKSELFGILENVVRALDTDEMTEEGFQSFSLLWESVREIINDRISELN